jgi:hypothetical protein
MITCQMRPERWEMTEEARNYPLLRNLLPQLASAGVERVDQLLPKGIDTALDGPLLQKLDRATPLRFDQGVIEPPEPALWG